MRSKYVLRFLALGYLALLLGIPVALVFINAFQDGVAAAWEAVTTPEAQHAFYLTFVMVAVAVPLNTIFGVLCALAIVRQRFRGRALLNAMVDLPFAVSPVVVGLALLLVYGRRDGWVGEWFAEHGIQIIFSTPGMILATMFVSLPFVVREVIPVLREIGTEQEQAAATLGASGFQTFFRVTLPAIRWGVAYGVVLTTARALGEFGAVSVVSGKLSGQTRDRHAVRRGALPALRPDRRLCCVRRAGAAGPRDAARDEPDQAEGGSGMSIVVESVSKRFGDFVALDDVSLNVRDGSLTALLGPSGGGKSTLLRVIAGLEQPDEGRVLIGGEDATAKPPQRRNVGFVFQHYAAFKHMTVAKNVAFGLTIRKRPKDEIEDRVDELLKLVHLDGFAHRYPSQLSGGQRQRMALARALAVQPRVLLLDEPFGALDATVRKELRAWLRRLHDEVHVTTVFVTHDQEEAMEVAEQIVVLNHGDIEQVGTPRDLYEKPANEFVMRFVGPVSELSGQWIRPHDVEILTEPTEGAAEAQIDRIVHLGFEVRVELSLGDGDSTWVQTTRAQVEELELTEGQIVWLRPESEPVSV